MPLSKLKSDYQNSEQFDNGRRPSGSRSGPIACRVCDKVFFDNVSLVLHFECHVKDGFRLSGRDLASLRRGQHMPSSWSPYSRSSFARMNEARHAAFSRMSDYFRPCPSSVNRTPSDPNRLYIPVMNVSQPIHHSITSQYGATSSSSCPLMYSQSGARNFAYGSAVAPLLQSREQNGGQTHFPDNIPPISQLENPIQEIIILSDDEEDDNKSTAEIDLTLKL
ncbi:hypothetical protein C2S52_006435 [Perilla frutescens var. hirtella]|uniref:C2H2-type domain-containing protein n=1 Tax=Perilla frutescens var. hirtella TaxID=608512 RepID=A0AAD4JJV6_PERFH|nr:hypothetical protein C2S51_009367 [Perilla frutescens var. frutescens]KAH6786883.1 hypothetical protein C2S52_006435 [Perilla frutescens var. hirtella]KAH6834649.1 hypothetical protein C2S53_009186 [Perilla frutescens var. hirtella]